MTDSDVWRARIYKLTAMRDFRRRQLQRANEELQRAYDDWYASRERKS